ncbi:MAG: Omp28-related outer membrane protein [Bacteroidota bacterium]
MKKFFVVVFVIFSSIILFSQNKVVLLESFTSTTCPPCVPANKYIDNWYANFANKNSVAIIKYHVWWPAPGSDPFYLENTTDVQNRRSYYSVNAVPYGYVDGVNYTSNFPTWVTAIQGKVGSAVNLNLVISKGLIANEVKVSVESRNNFAVQNLTLHVVLVESNLYYTGTNGDPIHNFVMRKMYPNHNGETFSITANQKMSFTKTIQTNNNWNKSNLAVVAFIQNNSNKEILQAVMMDYTVLTTVENESSIPEKFSLEQNYPNPFNPQTTIRYNVQSAAHVTLKVYDVLGREVAALVNEYKQAGTYNSQFSTLNSQLSSGVYFYRLTTPTATVTKKMLLAK